MSDYFTQLKAVPINDLIRIFEQQLHLPLLKIWEFTDELKPIDLYCYLYAKHGPPNGLQNLLRRNDSDNLIHWEWALANDEGLVLIQGHNFRTEAQVFRRFATGKSKDDFVAQLKQDFASYGRQIKAIRTRLEKWKHFVNPYHRIESVVDRHIRTLSGMDLDLERDRKSQPRSTEEMKDFSKSWNAIADKYTHALGLAFGVRGMLPVLAESFINFLLFAIAKPEIRGNKRLLEEALRRPVDVRVQTLHLSCIGFTAPVNYKHQACKDFHTLMNERNDMLHGNVDVDKLSFEEIYFDGRVPVFTSYGSFWDKSIGIEARTIRLDELEADRASVGAFRDYVLSLLESRVRKSVEYMLESPQLGFDPKRNLIGVLLPAHMVDSRSGPDQLPERAGQD